MDIPAACPLRTKRRSWRAELPSLALLTVALALFQAPVARAGVVSRETPDSHSPLVSETRKVDRVVIRHRSALRTGSTLGGVGYQVVLYGGISSGRQSPVRPLGGSSAQQRRHSSNVPPSLWPRAPPCLPLACGPWPLWPMGPLPVAPGFSLACGPRPLYLWPQAPLPVALAPLPVAPGPSTCGPRPLYLWPLAPLPVAPGLSLACGPWPLYLWPRAPLPVAPGPSTCGSGPSTCGPGPLYLWPRAPLPVAPGPSTCGPGPLYLWLWPLYLWPRAPLPVAPVPSTCGSRPFGLSPACGPGLWPRAPGPPLSRRWLLGFPCALEDRSL
ncbi:unnamed protein product [Boreogadus saida]